MKKISFTPKPTSGAGQQAADAWIKNRHQPIAAIKRLTIDVPLLLHQRVKSQCALEGLKMADVMRELLEKRFPADQLPDRQATDEVAR